MAQTRNGDADAASKPIEERLRLMVDQIPALVWSKLPDGSLDFFNQRFREYTGLSLEEGLGWGWIKVFHPDDRRMEEWRAALAAGEPFETEARLRGKDGKYRWFELRAVPVKNNQGVITKWYGTSTDIHDRKQAESELRQLVDLVPQCMCVEGVDGEVLYANEPLLDFFGFTLQEAQASDFRTRGFHPDDLERVRAAREDAVSRGVPWEVETRLRRKDGHYRWFLIRFNPLRDEQGNIIRWYAAGTDIHDRKQAEAELRQLVDAVPQHIIVLDGEGRRLHTNQPVLEYHGYSLGEFLVVDYSHCFHSDDVKSFERKLREGIASGEPWEAEVRVHRKDGQYRWFLTRANPLRDDQGRVVRWYVSRTDIEDRKQAEWELRKLVDAVPQHITVLAADGRRLYGNQVALDFHGCTLEEFLPENLINEKLHPEDRTRYWDTRKRGISTAIPFKTEARLLTKDGQYRWFLFLFNPLHDEQGHLVRWYATATDIEDRKQAEDALRRSEAYLAEAQRLSHTGSFAHDPVRGEITYWSQEAYRTFGFDPANGPVSYREARSRVHPEDLQKFEEARERGIRQKTGTSVDFRVVLPDGSIKYIHCVSRPFIDASGEVVELVGTNMDVTEQRLAQAALEKAFEEIKQLKEELYRENLALKEEIDQTSLFEEIVGSSEPLRRVLVQVTKVARADSTVLVSGETGTGKELVARAIHKRSARASRAFVSVNCAAIPAALIGSELFGHEKGAFTGATQRRLGRFELAEGGTLFLDEVGDLPGETQIALLRVLQEHQFERIGGNQTLTTNVRIIAATNRDLQAAIDAGTFRRDLFYRLNVFPIDVPPLRDRKEDIQLLVEYLTERYASKAGKKIKNIEKRTLELLTAYQWPGNIRELQNVIERAVILCDGNTLSIDEVWLQPAPGRQSEARNGLARLGSDREKALIESALRESKGRVAGSAGAAARLGIPRSTLETKIRALGIDKHLFKSRQAF
jgi:PAS domain S-box-containing protein